MKTYKSALTESIVAAADVVKNRFAGFDGNYCGADKKALGVFEVDTKTGQMAPVIVYGIALIEAAGTFAAGDKLVSDANGKAVKATAVSVSVPVDTTPVLSDAAQPTLVVAGGVLPQETNGDALDAGTAGAIVRVRLS